MLFKLMPALLKCDLVPIVPNAILHVLLTINLVVFLTSILEFVRSSICRYIGVFWIWGVGRDPFSDQFGPLF
jgi:hypothetical protein